MAQVTPEGKVFISHSSKDKSIAMRICEQLEKQGISCWIASQNISPGADYAEALIDAIEACHAMVLIVSENSNQSRHVAKEVDRAITKGKAVFPVRIRNVQPSKKLEYYISTAQWVEAWEPPFEQKIDQLARAIHELTNGSNNAERIDIPQKYRNAGKGWFYAAGIFLLLIVAVVIVSTMVAVRSEAIVTEQSDPGLSSSIAQTLEMAYSTELDSEGPAIAAAVWTRPGNSATLPWHVLKDGETLSSKDLYRIVFQAEEDSWCYVFQIDSAGQLFWVFPENSSEYSQGKNPVKGGSWIALPSAEQAYHLDENTGIEHVYVVATAQKWSDLEAALTKAQRSKSGQPIRHALQYKTRGIGGIKTVEVFKPTDVTVGSNEVVEVLRGESGVYAREFWFNHISPAGD